MNHDDAVRAVDAAFRADEPAAIVAEPPTRKIVRTSNDLGLAAERGADPRARRSRDVTVPVLHWRLLHDGPSPGARNMAVDHALAQCLESGEGVLRLYRWDRPTLSLGRNEPIAAYPLEAMPAGAIDIVRRPTGGRGVLHDAELTYAVVAPIARRGDGWGARAAYRAINEALAAALRSLGAPVAVVAGRVRALGPDAGPCFRSPAAGEVVASGRKLVGSAQARIGRALLQHGSILLAGSQRLLSVGGEGPLSPGGEVTLSELVPDVSIDEVAAAVAESLERSLGGWWAEGSLRLAEEAATLRLEAERYAQDSWTWRR